MRRFVSILLMTVLITLIIFTGYLFISVDSGLGNQMEVNALINKEDIDTKDVALKDNYVPDGSADIENSVLSPDSGQASIGETVDTANNMDDEYDISEEVQIIKAQAKKEEYKSNTEEIRETQKIIAADSLETNVNLDNRGGVDRKQQAEFSTASSFELLDWWIDADKLFEKGVPAVVVDVETGKSFEIVRTYGSNHADVETLTAEDTAVMKEIWGGEWNWERRAVIVTINGRKLAASASGMPHAGLDGMPEGENVENRSGDFGTGTNLDKIKGNDMDGHFDIHFLNSRTHGTDKVDEKHQEMVQKAFELGK